MKLTETLLASVLLLTLLGAPSLAAVAPLAPSDDFLIKGASVRYDEELDLLVFEQVVQGTMGGTLPSPRGQQHGAPVLAFVFPTSLAPEDVGFGGASGIVALAVTSHPDFDDTPLWDENLDSDFSNDGLTLHTHWVLLGEDTRVPGGLSVLRADRTKAEVILPPTNPGMDLYLDSPGHPVVTKGPRLRVVVPASRVQNKVDFNFDAVSAYMEVNTQDSGRPTLGVYKVYSVLSGDLSLPYRVKQ